MANSFRKDMQDAAKDIFTAFGDLNEKVTYRQTRPGVYDPVTGKTNDSVRNIPTEGIFIDFNERQKSTADVVAGDMLLMMPVSNLGVVPDTLDRVIRGSDEWTIVKHEVDPAGAAYSLHLRLK